MASTMASATAASAAASTITIKLKTWPVRTGDGLYLLKATKLTLAALRMSSTPIRMPTAFVRVMQVYMPSAKRTAPTIRKCGRAGVNMSALLDFLAGDHHRADQRGQQHQRHHLEREQVLAQEDVADGADGV